MEDTQHVEATAGNPAVRSKRSKMNAFWKAALPYILISPGVIFVGAILIYPMISGVISSLFTQHPLNLSQREFVGLAHFKTLFSDKIFYMAFSNTLIWTLGVVFGQFALGLGIALMLNEKFPGRGIYRSLILIPWVVPMIAAALTWKWIYSADYGVLNYFLKQIGLISTNIDWLGNPSIALFSVIMTNVWKGIPFVAVVLLAGLQSIDNEMYEAAQVSGANLFQRFWYITLPSLKGVSIVVIVLTTIWTFNQFDLLYLMTKGGPSNSTQIIPVYTYLNAFNFFKMNYAAAVSTVGVVLLSVLAFWHLRTSKEEG
ncbi:sugar ABC transporter permease [Xylanibacillus composti]|uniref:Sugar ABC transporter permease n=1 Tax=Xylanibacillus composti TaxID=1572762 RepID=A0A8J4H366_9BACL|nr:sugar ABC transporter permease [Xylanibacillus composti]MDT9726055.1 sugar ABC transporter permease [Xylanibacillus composti]GIQ68800.1 sugar ABC transporter permease [Xylanibacillus composti]